MNWLKGTWAIFEKDMRLELRSRYAINMLLMFVLSTMLLLVFAVGTNDVDPRVQSGLVWIVIMFAAAIGLSRSFVYEQEGNTTLLLRLHTKPTMVYAGKLAFNLVLMLGVSLLAYLAFWLLLRITPLEPGLFLTSLLLGAVALAGTTTLLSALIAQSSNKGTLLPVLLFPLLVPVLVSAVNASRSALPNGLGWSAATDDLKVLVAFAGATISASFLLFEYVWNE